MNLPSIANQIRNEYPLCSYDHRGYLTYPEKHAHIAERDKTEDFRIRYACFKFTVAKILQPKSILEIGVRGGISALAFLNACPSATYVGIDNSLDGQEYIDETFLWFQRLKLHATIVQVDSQNLNFLPDIKYDFAHIDGCHSEWGCYHDVSLAMDAKISWILVDDTNTESVFRGVIRAVDSKFEIFNFSETEGGSILIYRGER